MPERFIGDSSYLNAKSTTGTATRVKDVSSASGLCPICIRDCSTLCEVGLSAFRGREVLYPEPHRFGESTQGALKGFWIDWAHFNIQPRLRETDGVKLDPDQAIFPNVDVSTKVGKTALKLPILIGAYGSTEVARIYWKGLAAGAALCGIIMTIGENVCGMDSEARFREGKVIHSEELKKRVEEFRRFWDGEHGDVAVQTNVEDKRLGVDEYVLSKLEVNIIERKWGQGAKAIGGEVRLWSLEKALELKKRGYIVLPDPEDKTVQEAFQAGVFKSFERHSRVGAVDEERFLEEVDELRAQGARQVTLKTGAYGIADVAFTMRLASKAKLDYVTFDGAEGGTGMSPVPMIDEVGTPVVHLEAHLLRCARLLEKKGKHVPDLVIAGGFIVESQIFKAIAMSNFGTHPYVKAVLMGRSPLTAVMKANYFLELAREGRLPKTFTDLYGDQPEKFFISGPMLKATMVGRGKVPWEAVGLYGYLNDRIGVGLQQLMAGCRKWRLSLLSREDIASLTPRAKDVTGIPLYEDVLDQDLEEALD
ncbi:MAG: glutamate synthase-related protein [Candidatus Bathyarchaeia archaeon]